MLPVVQRWRAVAQLLLFAMSVSAAAAQTHNKTHCQELSAAHEPSEEAERQMETTTVWAAVVIVSLLILLTIGFEVRPTTAHQGPPGLESVWAAPGARAVTGGCCEKASCMHCTSPTTLEPWFHWLQYGK